MLVEPVAGSPWNGWPDVHGIGGRITVVRAYLKLGVFDRISAAIRGIGIGLIRGQS